MRSRQPVERIVDFARIWRNARDERRFGVFGILRDFQTRRFERDRDRAFVELVDETARVFRTGELFAKASKSEPVVNALIQDAAEFFVALDD